MTSKRFQHFPAGVPAVHGHNPAAGQRACPQQLVENVLLQVEVTCEFITAIQADLTNVFGPAQQPDE